VHGYKKVLEELGSFSVLVLASYMALNGPFQL